MIDLYAAPTPEGWKVSIALEELGIPYVVHPIDACSDPRLVPDFLRVGPCGCVPAIIDHDADDCAVFEAGAILVYLAEKTGRLMPRDAAGRAHTMQWLMFNAASVGRNATPVVAPGQPLMSGGVAGAGETRAQLRTLFSALDRQLQNQDYLAGTFSIADIAQWAWVRMHAWSDIDMTGYDALARWLDRIALRDACRRGLTVPQPFEPAEQVYRVKSILLR